MLLPNTKTDSQCLHSWLKKFHKNRKESPLGFPFLLSNDLMKRNVNIYTQNWVSKFIQFFFTHFFLHSKFVAAFFPLLVMKTHKTLRHWSLHDIIHAVRSHMNFKYVFDRWKKTNHITILLLALAILIVLRFIFCIVFFSVKICHLLVNASTVVCRRKKT